MSSNIGDIDQKLVPKVVGVHNDVFGIGKMLSEDKVEAKGEVVGLLTDHYELNRKKWKRKLGWILCRSQPKITLTATNVEVEASALR